MNIGNFKPEGKYHMDDLGKVGGVVGVMGRLKELGILNENCETVEGRTWGELVGEWERERGGKEREGLGGEGGGGFVVAPVGGEFAGALNHIIILHG